MNDIVELILIIIIGVTGFTLLYKLLPFRNWKNSKPRFTLFPKYIAQFDIPVDKLESNLATLKFEKQAEASYSRGKVYGDFSANAIKLSVIINNEDKTIKVCSSFFGILFGTGDIWQVTADIIQE